MTKRDEAAQAAAEAEAAEEARAAEGDTGIVSPAQGGSAPPQEAPEAAGPSDDPDGPIVEEEPEDEVEAYPLTSVTPEMLEGGDWQEYRPSITFRAKTMPEPFSVETKDGLVIGEAGDVLAVVGDDLHVFSSSVFAAEYQPVVHGA